MKDDSDFELRKYFWRAAAICRRHGLKQSAVVIADNIDILTQAILTRPDVRATPLTAAKPPAPGQA